MAATIGKRVVSIGAHEVQWKEAPAAAVIRPGSIVALNSAGALILNATTGLGAVRVAAENDIFGKSIDDNWAVGETVLYGHLESGMEFNGLVPAAAAAIVIGDYITFDAAGGVIKGVQATAIGQAKEAVDNSAGGSAVRLLVAVK